MEAYEFRQAWSVAKIRGDKKIKKKTKEGAPPPKYVDSKILEYVVR